MPELISTIVFTIGISLFLNIILKKLNLHSIIWYIFTGSIVSMLFNLQNTKSMELDLIAEFGIAFLMFSIGLEFSIHRLKSMKNEVFFYWGLQVFLTSVFCMLIMHGLLKLSIKESLIISLALSLSSTAIVLKLLNESRKIYKTYGKNAVWVLLFQDMAVIPILLLISLLANEEGTLGVLLWQTFLNALCFLGLSYFLGRYILPNLLAYAGNTKSDEIFIGAIMLIVIGSAQLAHLFWFSYSLWTFLAGMIIAKTHYKHQIEADLIPFRDLLLWVFFISVGMQLNISVIPGNIGIILLALCGIILVKALIIYTIIHLRQTQKTSIKTAIILAQVWEFSFVIFELAKINGILNEGTKTQIIMVVIILSMLLTPFIFNHLQGISSLFAKGMQDNEDLVEKSSILDHVIVCGYGGLGQKIVERLKKLNIPYIVIERDRKLIKAWIERKDVVIYGNAAKRRLLKKVNITYSKAVILAISANRDLNHVWNEIRNAFPEVRLIASATNLHQKEDLEKMKVDCIIDEMETNADSFLYRIIEEDLPWQQN